MYFHFESECLILRVFVCEALVASRCTTINDALNLKQARYTNEHVSNWLADTQKTVYTQ